MKLDFSPQAQKALQIMEETDNNMFLTGKAGTGKSTLLDHFRKNTEKEVAILAPTGVAAINVDGETIHSFFGLKPGFELEEAQNKGPSPWKKEMMEKLKTVVIDEISMVRADLLDAVDVFLRKARECGEPFGGVQMIFIGDLYQLPPVVTSADRERFREMYPGPFFFDSEVMRDGVFELDFIELEKIYRQNDNEFIRVLNAVRNNSIVPADMDVFNQRVNETFEPRDKDYIYLMTTNADAKIINDRELDKLKGPEIVFHSHITGKIERSQYPADTELWLRKGAQIMFLKNDSEGRWVNGTIGKVVDIDEDEELLEVEIVDGKLVEVSYFTWEISRYVMIDGKLEREIIGSFKQIPVRLAWAITIHKSQGKTFDNVIIDLGRRSFAHGQTYVALSRCRTLEGMVLKKPIKKSDVIMDYRVRKFITDFQYLVAEKSMSFDDKVAYIESAIANRSVLKMVYLKGQDERSERRVMPLSVDTREFKGHSFMALEAKCLMRDANRVFNVARILEVENE